MSNGSPTGTISGPTGDIRLGGLVTFQTTSSGLKGPQYPMIVVAAYQDVDGDGTVTIPTHFEGSPDLVYAQLDHPNIAFLLGGGSSLWLQRGGSATCIARLYAYAIKGKDTTPVLLAETPPWTATA